MYQSDMWYKVSPDVKMIDTKYFWVYYKYKS